jgi:peptidoglycan hydrolase-like protein with peptidoglycan-binding domain
VVDDRSLERSLGDFKIVGVLGDTGLLMTQMRSSLTRKGYSIGPAAADGNINGDTLNALQAFQDDNGLTVQPNCDQRCWTALG